MNNKELEAKELIEGSNGKFFSVDFVKKNGEIRHMVARIGVSKYVTGKGMSWNPEEHGYKVVWEPGEGYKIVNLKTIKKFKQGEVEKVWE